MANEHYVPRSYLRLFSPEDEGLISRYSLVEKHGGGDYYDAKDRYSINKAASAEEYADGFLEHKQVNNIEKVDVEALRKIVSGTSLSDQDIAHISQFVVLQRDRSPKAKVFHETNQEISRVVGGPVDHHWESVISLDAGERYKSLLHMGWLVVENKTSVPLITSDSPVVFYQEEQPDDEQSGGFSLEGKQIFCPLGPDHLLVLLDPSQFDISTQYPDTNILRRSITDRGEIHKANMLQIMNCFNEIFGPVGRGNLLEQLVETLCQHFPDSDYVRGPHATPGEVAEARKSGIRESSANPMGDSIPSKYQKIIVADSKESRAIWQFDHEIDFVSELKRDEPDLGC